jgi:hypothetical protein
VKILIGIGTHEALVASAAVGKVGELIDVSRSLRTSSRRGK